MSHTKRDANPDGGHASDQAIVVGRGRRQHPAHAGQIPGIAPSGVRRFTSHNVRWVASTNPASQPQASHHEDLQAVQGVLTWQSGRSGSGSEVVTVNPLREFTWRTVPTPLFSDSTEWCLRLEPHPGGTRITQSFTVLKGPWLLDRICAMLIPAHRDRDARLGADLARIGQAASAGLAP